MLTIRAARLAAACVGVVVMAFPLHLRATDAQPTTADPRVMELSAQLRCLVCQNQTIAESNATLAVDFKKQIAEMVEAGKSDDEIIRFMVDRYGDFVLYKPPVKSSTLLLWFGPFGFLALACVILMRRLAARPRAPVTLSPDEEARVERLLVENKQEKPR